VQEKEREDGGCILIEISLPAGENINLRRAENDSHRKMGGGRVRAPVAEQSTLRGDLAVA